MRNSRLHVSANVDFGSYLCFFFSFPYPLDVISTSHFTRVPSPCLLMTCRKILHLCLWDQHVWSHTSLAPCVFLKHFPEKCIPLYMLPNDEKNLKVSILSFTHYWDSCQLLLLVVETAELFYSLLVLPLEFMFGLKYFYLYSSLCSFSHLHLSLILLSLNTS